MIIEWVERHTIDLSDYVVERMQKEMDDYYKANHSSLVEDTLQDLVGERHYNNYQYVDNWKELVEKVTAQVKAYKEDKDE